jgi:hypothetical protein
LAPPSGTEYSNSIRTRNDRLGFGGRIKSHENLRIFWTSIGVSFRGSSFVALKFTLNTICAKTQNTAMASHFPKWQTCLITHPSPRRRSTYKRKCGDMIPRYAQRTPVICRFLLYSSVKQPWRIPIGPDSPLCPSRTCSPRLASMILSQLCRRLRLSGKHNRHAIWVINLIRIYA